jgi:hypothetical protein
MFWLFCAPVAELLHRTPKKITRIATLLRRYKMQRFGASTNIKQPQI